jgi:enoyl-CoA hydratase/carnithine racemase
MLAIAHDFRVMRSDRGYLCFPEVDIHIPFTPGMAAMIMAKVPPQTAMASMTTGRRFGGEDARAYHLVDATADEVSLVDAAVAAVTPLVGKDAATLANIKATMFADVLAAFAKSSS